MKTVLVTGATGFIGRHALPALAARGYDVHALHRPGTPPPPDAAHWHEADLLQPDSVARLLADLRPTHLLHFAWNVLPPTYRTSPENLRWLQAGIDLLRRFADHGGLRLVTAGTCLEYDPAAGRCRETASPLRPNLLYSTCKHALREVTESFALQTGLSHAWGRIFFLFGPHEYPQRLVPAVITALLRGQPARCSHGHQIRDFMYVQDVADAFAALLDSPVTGPVNIASGQPVPLKHIITTIAEKLARPDLVQLGALPAGNEPPLITADTARLNHEVGWRPRFTLDQALDQTIAWWKSHDS